MFLFMPMLELLRLRFERCSAAVTPPLPSQKNALRVGGIRVYWATIKKILSFTVQNASDMIILEVSLNVFCAFI